jgi:hypothetical protein
MAMSTTRLDVELARTQAPISKRRRRRVLRWVVAFAVLAGALVIALALALGDVGGTPTPTARFLAFMVDDPATGQFLLAGGEIPSTTGDPEQSTPLYDMWRWTGRSWTKLSTGTPANVATEAENGEMTYDPVTRQVVLVTTSPGTLIWSGHGWHLAKGSAPTGVVNFVVFDPDTNQLLALASPDDNASFTTWLWTTKGWQRLPGAATVPAFPYPVGNVTYDGDTRQLLYVGWVPGHDRHFVMEAWTGRTWVQLHPTLAPSYSLDLDGFAYDSATHQVVLYEDPFPPKDSVNETWIWNGGSWAEAHPGASPPSTDLSSLGFDPASKQLLLFGGSGVNGALSDTWDWTGKTWVKVG